MEPKAKIIYFGDPMCSWCWGFSPQFDQLMETLGDEVTWEMYMGGLRPGTQTVMDDSMKKFLREHWIEIGEKTGQPFSLDLLDRDDFVYDTLPAAKAVVAIKDLHPNEAWSFFKDVQHAFYAKNEDPRLIETYLPLIKNRGWNVDEFTEFFQADSTLKKTWEEFSFARQLGVNGFPTVLMQTASRWYRISVGYALADDMLSNVHKAFAHSNVEPT